MKLFLLLGGLIFFLPVFGQERTTYFPKERRQVDALPKPERVWVFLLAGQSNMAGRGQVLPEDTLAHPRIISMGADQHWFYAKEPLHFYEPRRTGLDCGQSFARELLKCVPDSITIALVPCAVGGSSAAQWVRDTVHRGVRLLSNLRQRLEVAQTIGQIKGILWHQGESDANARKLPNYHHHLTQLFQHFRTLAGAATLPILVGELGTYKTPPEKQEKWDALNAIIQNMAASDPYQLTISTADFNHRGDYTHFDAAAQRLLGVRFAQSFCAQFLP